MACDASPFGVGAILSQILADGSEHPVAYGLRSLSPAEQNDSHLDRGTCYHFWYWEISPIHLWQEIHPLY